MRARELRLGWPTGVASDTEVIEQHGSGSASTSVGTEAKVYIST